MNKLKDNFIILDLLFNNCDIDYNDLLKININKTFFDNHDNVRLENSFLFDFIKIQDKIGTKLFKLILFELKEISDFNISMKDALNLLEKLKIINSSESWDKIKEIRNNLTLEYPLDIDEKIDNIKLVIHGYEILQKLYMSIKNYYEKNGLVK